MRDAMLPDMNAEQQIEEHERALRAWFTAAADALGREVDGLDIGWGGVQRWAMARMPALGSGPHLDVACGYGTFLAELGWRYAGARLVGLNIDFEGPHAMAAPLLREAGVNAQLVRADARSMPFADAVFASVSCFLGLQDIEIGFGPQGVQDAVAEAVRVLRPGGAITLLDEFPFERFDVLLSSLPLVVLDRRERALDVRWPRPIAQRAIRLYAQGYVAQARLSDAAARTGLLRSELARMRGEMESQLAEHGYYVPFGPVRMVVARRQNLG